MHAFTTIKELLISPPVLRSPTTYDRIVLETDASDSGSGVCLKGIAPDNQEFIIAYSSHKFKNNEINWNIVEKEGFALVDAIRKYRHYLLGKPFTIRIDSRIIMYVQSKHTPKNKKLLDWALELSEYDFYIQHIPTTKNQISDCLSRLAHVDYPSVAAVNTPDIPLPHTSVADWVRAQHDDIEISQCSHYLNAEQERFRCYKTRTIQETP